MDVLDKARWCLFGIMVTVIYMIPDYTGRTITTDLVIIMYHIIILLPFVIIFSIIITMVDRYISYRQVEWEMIFVYKRKIKSNNKQTSHGEEEEEEEKLLPDEILIDSFNKLSNNQKNQLKRIIIGGERETECSNV